MWTFLCTKYLLQKNRFSTAEKSTKILCKFWAHEFWFLCKPKVLRKFCFSENARAFSCLRFTSRRSFKGSKRFCHFYHSAMQSFCDTFWSRGAFIFLYADIWNFGFLVKIVKIDTSTSVEGTPFDVRILMNIAATRKIHRCKFVQLMLSPMFPFGENRFPLGKSMFPLAKSMFPLGKRDDRQVKGLALWFLSHVSFREKHVSFREKHVSLGGNRASTSVFATCLLGVRTIFGFRNMFARSPKTRFCQYAFSKFCERSNFLQNLCTNYAYWYPRREK